MSESDRAHKASNRPRTTTDEQDPEIVERKCAHCAYARWMPPGASALLGHWFGRWVCTNHPDSEGDMQEVHPRGVCPNFRFRRRPVQRIEPAHPGVKHIALTRNKYAIVDTTDFAELNRWKWTAYYT